MNLEELLSTRERPTAEFDWSIVTKSIKGKFMMRVLTLAEMEEAAKVAAKFIREREILDDEVIANVKAVAALEKSILVQRDGMANVTPFSRSLALWDKLTLDELTVLNNCYSETLRTLGPIETQLDSEHIQKIKDAAKLDPTDSVQLTLLRFSREALTEIIMRICKS